MSGRSSKEHNRAFQKYINQGLFEEKSKVCYKTGIKRVIYTTYITTKGQAAFTLKYGSSVNTDQFFTL